jgi:hypothetical protein
MTQEELEARYVAELARITATSVSLVAKIVEVQIAMIMRDLSLSGEAQTLVGRIKLIKGNIVLIDPNSYLQRMLEKDKLIDRLMRELGER